MPNLTERRQRGLWQPGLSSATASDVDAVTAAATKIGETVVNQPVCELGQQAASRHYMREQQRLGLVLCRGIVPEGRR